MKHKAKLTISRPSRSHGEEIINIQVSDAVAKVKFLDLEIDCKTFAECLTGLSRAECDMEFQNLDVLGMARENDTIQFKMPEVCGSSHDKKAAIEEAKKYTPEGWTASEYYGSQTSFFSKGRDTWAKTSITRWVRK
jgi:hypothetical protein